MSRMILIFRFERRHNEDVETVRSRILESSGKFGSETSRMVRSGPLKARSGIDIFDGHAGVYDFLWSEM